MGKYIINGYKQFGIRSHSSDNYESNVYWYKTIDSTNLEIKRLLLQKKKTPVVVISDYQISGYGKNGRKFLSNAGGLYLSLGVNVLGVDNKNIGLLTTGIVTIVHKLILKFWKIKTQIKWVNDLLFEEKKVAGILVEHFKESEYIIGIGINFHQEELEKYVSTAGNILKHTPDENLTILFVSDLIDKIIAFIYSDHKEDHIMYYKQNLPLLNHLISVKLGDKLIEGVAKDLTYNGNLILKKGSEIIIISAGEVTKVYL